MEKLDFTFEDLFGFKKATLLMVIETVVKSKGFSFPNINDVLVKKSIVDDVNTKIVIHYGHIKIIISENGLAYISHNNIDDDFTLNLKKVG